MRETATVLMSEERCKLCGAPRSNRLDGNCPNCLIRLGVESAPDGEGSATVPGSETPAAARLKQLGGYELLEVIAHGGVGVVYRARQRDLQRLVAVKVLLSGQFAKDSSLERFRREAEAAASLSHPNVVPIYEVGEQNGQPFFSMQLVEGRSLSDLVRNKPLPPREAAQLLKTIVEAVHYAHERGILHRDLKPSNVIIDTKGVPHITDFGFAKRIAPEDGGAEASDRITVSGEVFGTPNYMPPEQANPGLGPTTVASDVYSLGALLYQLLTARPPFLADSITQTLRLVAESEPASPRILNPSVPQDLETICLKCLEKNPRQRFSSARELAEELGRYLAGEPIHARPAGPAERVVRWCHRKPALAISLAVATVFFLLILVGSPIALILINNSRQSAEASNQKYRHELFSAYLGQARATVLSGEIGHRELAMEALRQAAGITNSAELRREAVAALTLPDLRFEYQLPERPVSTMVTVDPSFTVFARCLDEAPIELCSAKSGSTIKSLPSSGGICRVAHWDSTGQYLAARRDSQISGASTLEVWDTKAGRLISLLNDGDYQAFSFSKGKPRMAVVSSDGRVGIWEVDKHIQLSSFRLTAMRAWSAYRPRQPGNWALSTAFSPDGERIAVAYSQTNDSTIGIYQCRDGVLLQAYSFTNVVTDVDWDASGRWIGATDFSGFAYLIDRSENHIEVLGRHKSTAATARFSPDGGFLFTGGWEREMLCWDVPNHSLAFSIPRDSFMIEFSTIGSECALINANGPQFYAFDRPTASKQFSQGLGRQPFRAAFSPDSRYLAVSDSRRLHVWDMEGGLTCASFAEGGDSQPVFCDHDELFAGEQQGLSRWRVKPGADQNNPPSVEECPIPNLSGARHVCYGRAGLVFNSTNGMQLIRPGNRDVLPSEWKQTSWGICDMSPDGRLVTVFAPFSKVLHVYHLPGLESVAHVTNEAQIVRVTFPPGASELAVSSRRHIEFWDTTTWRKTREIQNFMDYLAGPKSGSMWLVSDFSSAGLYDPKSLDPLLPLPRGTIPLAISPDERWLAVSVDGRRLQVLNLPEVRRCLAELGLDWPNP